MQRLFPAVIPFLLASLAVLPAFADDDEEEQWFRIELIVFEHQAPPGVEAEAWSDDPGGPDIGAAIELAPSPEMVARLLPIHIESSPARLAYQQLDASELALAPLHDRLEAADDYAPLIHVGWRQPLASGRESAPVRIHQRPATDDEPRSPADLPASALFIDTSAVRAPQPAASEATAPLVDGIVRVRRNRFVHADLDLLLRKPASEEAESGWTRRFRLQPAEAGRVFRLQDQRRMRPDEVHYFDHPVFGVILRVTRIEMD